MRSIIVTLSLALCVSASQAQSGGFDEGSVSFSNPRTHGDFRPRLSGKMNSVRLKLDDGELSWTGLVHKTRGAIQMWGEPAMIWDGEELSEIDAQIRQLVDRNYDLFKIKSSDLLFNKTRSAYAGPFRTLTYDRLATLDDSIRYRVNNASVVFRFKAGRLIQITNNSFGEIGIYEAPVFSAEDAQMRVTEDLGLDEEQVRLVSKVETQLQPFFIKGGDVRFRLVHQVAIERKNPQGLWYYSVSAADGAVVQIVNGLVNSSVVGEIHPRLATDELVQAPLPFVLVKGSGGQERSDANGEFNMDPNGAIAELTGIFVTPFQQGKTFTARANQDGNIQFSANQSLDGNMAYYHVTKVNQYVQRFIQNDFLKKAIKVNTKVTNGPMKHCNAWYSPMAKDLNFLEAGASPDGQYQCNNSSHVADVIYHEWGHALDDSFGGIQDGAFSEAIGDINSFIQTGDSKLAPSFFQNQDRPIRDVSQIKVYPKDRSQNPHAEGLIVGGAWWEVFTKMRELYGPEEGRDKMASIFYRHLAHARNYLDSYQMALVVDDNDGDLSNGTPHLCLLNAAFAKRGLTPVNDRCKQQ